MRSFIRSIALSSFAAICLVAGSSNAASVSGTRFTSPFPADLAFPGFTDFTQANLTTLGSLDWIRLGESTTAGTPISTGFNEKAGGTAITGYTQSGFMGADNGAAHFLTYSDGTAPVTSAATLSGQSIQRTSDDKMSFDVAASNTQQRELTIFGAVTGGATGQLVAQLQNAANQPIGPSYTNDLSGGLPAVYRIDFQGDGIGDHLLVTYTRTVGSGTDRIALSAATLSVVPEPALLAGLCVAGALLARKRRRCD
jgi:hypothetical protein